MKGVNKIKPYLVRPESDRWVELVQGWQVLGGEQRKAQCVCKVVGHLGLGPLVAVFHNLGTAQQGLAL